MKATAVSFLVCALGVLGAVDGARAGDYDDALAAVARGDNAKAFAGFEAAAGRGDVAAEYNLGRLYAQDVGGSPQPSTAAFWFQKAADQGNPGAEFNLGLLYQSGRGVPRDTVKAVQWYSKAAAQGYSTAEVKLGDLYASGEGVGTDESAARSWYQKAADQGDPDGEFALGMLYAKEGQPRLQPAGPLTQVRFEALMDNVFGRARWRETGGYRTPERENELRAQGALTVPLGMRSSHSFGTRDAPGAYDIVVDGMTPELAARKLRSSGLEFKRLFPESTHGTQGPHLHVEPSPAMALAAPHSRLEALSAAISRDGFGMTKPAAGTAKNSARDEAITWLTKAAEQGRPDAELQLGRIYLAGDGAQADAALALQWLRTAAGHGSMDAQILLGEALAKGQDGPRNLPEAHRWLVMAVSQASPTEAANVQSAQRLLRKIDTEMTSAELNEVMAAAPSPTRN